MAITRAQQARQMYKKGSKPVEQAGVMNYMPSEMITVPKIAKSSPDTPTAKLAYITPEEQDILIDLNLYGSLDGKPNRGPGGIPSLEGDFGSPTGTTYSEEGTGRDVSVDKEGRTVIGGDVNQGVDVRKARSEAAAKAKAEAEAKEKRKTIRERIKEYNKNYKKKQLTRYQKNIIDELNAKLAGLENFDGFYGDTDETYEDFIKNYSPSITEFGPGGTGKYSQQFIDDVLSGKRKPPESFIPIDLANVPGGFLTKGLAAGVNVLGKGMAGPTTMEELMDLYSGDKGSYIRARDLDIDDVTSKEMMEEFEPNRFKLLNPEPEGDGPQSLDPCKGPNPPAYCFIGDKADDTQEAVVTRNLSGLTPRIGGSMFDFTGMADGGIAGLDREAFLLGGIAKGLKKAVRGVKKLAKSPIGKAALLGGLAYFGGGGGLPKFLSGKGLGGFSMETLFSKANPLLFTDGKLSLGKLALASAVTPFLFPGEKKDEFDLDAYYAANRLDPNAPLNTRIAGSQFDFYGGVKAADGGRIGYQEGGDAEPVAKKTMPLIDMDGKEKDYRETGGFVDMGRMERADDVPARLSKNEFVFTADAVRNAGEGDIDKGAEVI